MKHQGLSDLLTGLIAVPSVNPAYSQDPSVTHERRMALHLRDLLEARGLGVEWREDHGPERPAVIGSAGPADGPSLLFEVHLDTVGVDHMTLPPFEGFVRDGKLYGRGACDMKGATAALLYALTPARVRALTGRGVRLLVVGAPDEECGGAIGARSLAQRGLRADHAVVLEPTRCVPVVAHKGAYWYEVTLRGRSGHGSQPEAGVSTNAALARFLPEVLRAHKALQDMVAHPLLGRSTLNIGAIQGGSSYNIIPDRTVLRLDRRVVPNERPEMFEQALTHILDELRKEGRILSGDCKPTCQTPAFATSPDGALARSLLAAIETVSGERPACVGTSWVSDASQLSPVCGETLVFGPGDIAQAHTEDEYIELAELEKGTDILAAFLDAYHAPKS